VKIRQGFVSNSSSSSFVVVIPKKNFEKYMKALDPFEVAVSEKNFKKAKINGEDFMVWLDHVYSDSFDEDGRYSKRALEIAKERGVKLAYDPEKDEYGDIGCEYSWSALSTARSKAKKFGGWTDSTN
jgi:hypothetical protein